MEGGPRVCLRLQRPPARPPRRRGRRPGGGGAGAPVQLAEGPGSESAGRPGHPRLRSPRGRHLPSARCHQIAVCPAGVLFELRRQSEQRQRAVHPAQRPAGLGHLVRHRRHPDQRRDPICPGLPVPGLSQLARHRQRVVKCSGHGGPAESSWHGGHHRPWRPAGTPPPLTHSQASSSPISPSGRCRPAPRPWSSAPSGR